MTIEVFQFPCLQDNYGYLVHDHSANLTTSIDTPDVDAILAALQEKNWTLTHIFNTHHHRDHIGGNLALKDLTNCIIIGSSNDQDRIPGIDQRVLDGEEIYFGKNKVLVQETPGHTSGHIVFHFTDQKLAFVGDTLFSLGCGRLFEGSATQMWESLQKIMQWPDETLIYCAHEYTQANAQFAVSIEPENENLLQRVSEVEQLRKAGRATIPTTVGLEKKTNPFLRPDSLEIQTKLQMTGSPVEKVFARIRALKDNF